MLFAKPPATFSSSGSSSGNTANVTTDAALLVVEAAISANEWFYSRDIQDKRYPLRFRADKSWYAVLNHRMSGTWRVLKENTAT
jgi:hypothetical protein